MKEVEQILEYLIHIDPLIYGTLEPTIREVVEGVLKNKVLVDKDVRERCKPNTMSEVDIISTAVAYDKFRDEHKDRFVVIDKEKLEMLRDKHNKNLELSDLTPDYLCGFEHGAESILGYLTDLLTS